MILTAEYLQAMISQAYALPADNSLSELTPQLMTHLGSTDSEVREYSLDILWEWIARGVYDDAGLRAIGSQMAHNLMQSLGEAGRDDVFLRAFSALILGAVVNRASAQPVNWEDALLRSWFEASLAFFEYERDVRGYVPEKGWAHAVAHGADLLQAWALSRFVTRADLQRLLTAAAGRVSAPADRVYLHEEEERLARMVMSILLRGEVPLSFVEAWLNGLVQQSLRQPWTDLVTNEPANHARVNTKNFVRALYFQLLFGVRNYQNLLDGFPADPAEREVLLERLLQAVRAMDAVRFYRKAE